MLIGTINFKCDDCNNVFVGPNMEWNATVFPAPCKCPKCGSFHTMPAGAFFQKSIYKEIWESIDASRKNQ